MTDDGGQTALESNDLGILDLLFERELADELKAYIMEEFGKDGRRISIHKAQNEAFDACKNRYNCSNCGYCVPYLNDAVIVHIVEIVEAYYNGLLDIATGKIHAPKKDPDSCF